MILLQLLNILYFLLPFFECYLYYKPSICYNVNTISLYSYFFSTIHSFIMSYNALLYIFNYIDSNLLYGFFPYSICYFLTDIFIVCYTENFKKNRYNFIIHHLIACLGYYLCIFEIYENKFNSSNIICQLLISELSIIPLNICWFLIKINKKDSNIFYIMQFITAIFYFIFRILNLSYLLYYFIIKKVILLVFMQFFIVLLNYYWFYKLIQ